MENKQVQRMIKQVNEVISVEHERESLFSALKRYQTSSDVKALVNDLKRALNEPQKLELYDFVRPLIRPIHQQHYDKLTPSAPGQRLRVVKLHRRPTESLGFAVRGGIEHGIGVFVSHVESGSQAELHGLRLGDEIIRVNGFTISEAIHDEVLNLIKGREDIELKVTNIGMIPIKQSPGDPVTWQYVDKPARAKQQTKSAVPQQINTAADVENIKLFINLRGASSLGCSIVSGPKHFPGIFIEMVKSGSLGEDYGLEIGDQLIEVNGTSFLNIKHKEAIVELKGSKELNMVIRKGAGLPLLQAKSSLAKESPKPSPTPVKRQVPVSQDEPVQIVPSESPDIVCEILEEDQYAQEEKRRWEEEQERLGRVREEELVLKAFKRKESERVIREERRSKELEKRKEEEERSRQKEEMRKAEERRKMEEEAEIAENEKQDRLKQQAKRYKQNKKKEKENEFYHRVRIHQREIERAKQEYFEARHQELMEIRSSGSAILAGRSALPSSMKPTLLGAVTSPPPPPQLTSSYVEDKDVRLVVIEKEDNMVLDIDLEGGSDSPLGGKIVVAEVFYGGTASKSGEVKRGAQILSVDGTSLVDVTLEEAQRILENAESSQRDVIKLEIIESDIGFDDETTYF